MLMVGMVLGALALYPILHFRRTHGREEVLSVLTAKKNSVSHEQLMCFLTYGHLEFCYAVPRPTE